MSSQRGRVCLIEDDPIMGESLAQRFQLEGIGCSWFTTGAEAMQAILKRPFALILSDIRLPDFNGEALYSELIASQTILPPVIFITGFGTIDQAVRLINLGASDYITKPFDIDQLVEKIDLLLPNLTRDQGDEPVLGVSPVMRRIEGLFQRAAQHDVSVLITGESGVGKEVAARYFHRLQGARSSAPFVAINCAAFQETMLEAELFGHEKGAFTGATRTHQGVFERASGGTLLLDEIGDMPPGMQVKLLRALQERRVTRVGGEREINVDVRIICATNHDLGQRVAEGAFREDLYYRINGLHVHLPPLRDRHEDILWLAKRLLAGFAAESGRHCTLSPAAERFLIAQRWPGNVREMEHALKRAAIFSNDDRLDPFGFGCALSAANSDLDADAANLRAYMAACERRKIMESLIENDWHVIQAAKALGISRKSLWEKMQRHQVEKPA